MNGTINNILAVSFIIMPFLITIIVFSVYFKLRKRIKNGELLTNEEIETKTNFCITITIISIIAELILAFRLGNWF